jgi:hypothetical protein
MFFSLFTTGIKLRQTPPETDRMLLASLQFKSDCEIQFNGGIYWLWPVWFSQRRTLFASSPDQNVWIALV